MYNLYYRLCFNGSKQVQRINFQYSYALTVTYTSIRIVLALAAALYLVVYALDVDNVFQCTPKIYSKSSPSAYFSMPPFYIAWFIHHFPKIKIDGPAPYFLQMLNFMKVNKAAGLKFQDLIKEILKDIDL